MATLYVMYLPSAIFTSFFVINCIGIPAFSYDAMVSLWMQDHVYFEHEVQVQRALCLLWFAAKYKCHISIYQDYMSSGNMLF